MLWQSWLFCAMTASIPSVVSWWIYPDLVRMLKVVGLKLFPQWWKIIDGTFSIWGCFSSAAVIEIADIVTLDGNSLICALTRDIRECVSANGFALRAMRRSRYRCNEYYISMSVISEMHTKTYVLTIAYEFLEQTVTLVSCLAFYSMSWAKIVPNVTAFKGVQPCVFK
jgi:hypothetical protein